MHWYNGGIVDAIQSSKQKGAIFVVYIEGKDDKSTQITNLINNSEVASRLETNKFVAVKLEAESVSHQQFSEIFNATAVPSIYFIGKDGKTLDIVTEGKDVHDLVLRIDGVLRKAGVTGANSAMQSDSLIKGEQSTSTPPDVVCENGVCTIKKSDTATSEALTEQSEEQSGNSALSPEEKLVKAKELLEKQRLIKQKEEEEKERQREIERRKVGQNVQQMKRWQEDEELKQVMEEREREKRDNQAARNRVLAQIAQDKAERAAKFSPPASSQAKPSTSGVSNPSKATTTTNVAKLQFKLPDGQTHTHEFPSSDALDVVVTYIKATLNLPFSNFTLSTTFPRREFTANDYSMSLADLQLVPNAVILILPLNQGTVSTAQGTNILSSFLWTFVAPFVGIYNFLRSFILGTREDPTGTGGKRQASSADSSGSRSSKSVTAVSSKYDLESKLKEAGSKLVVIDFFATWCGPCKMIAPQLQELAREFPYVVFLKVDVDQNADIARSYGVSAMPTFVFIKNKRTVTTFSGADYYQLRDTIVRYK